MRPIKAGLLFRQLGGAATHHQIPVYAFRRMSTQHGASSESISRLAARIPKGTWDTHMHVVDPQKFPLSKDAKYQPSAHTIDQATKFLSTLGISKMVIVQPSVYGTDNSCTLDGLKKLGPENGRAVVQFDPDSTSEDQLREWHELGVRGVRLNFKSVGARVADIPLGATLQKYANAIRSLDWVLEIYIAMEDIPLLEPAVPDLGDVKICIDHFGHPSAASLATAQSSAVLPGFTSLAKLLERDNVWIKVSGSYRLDMDRYHPLVQSLGRWILRTRPDRCVFATDWPHTQFEGLDVTQYIEELFTWCEMENVPLEKILVKNAEELFDAK